MSLELKPKLVVYAIILAVEYKSGCRVRRPWQWSKQQHESRRDSDTCAEAEGHGRSASHPESAGSGTRDKRPDADGNIIDPKRGAAQAIGRNVGDGSSQQPLRYAQLQAPECGTERRQPDRARIGQYHIGANQDDRANPELEATIEMVRENTERIRCHRKYEMHHDQDHWHEGRIYADVMGLEHEECLTETRQGQETCDCDHPPECCRQGCDVATANWEPPLAFVID